MGKSKNKTGTVKTVSRKRKLSVVAKKFNMSVPGIHHEIKRIINKMVDRLKPVYSSEGKGVFDIVIDLSERLGIRNNPGEIFNKLNPVNKKLCIIQAKKKAPHLANQNKELSNIDHLDLMESIDE